MVGCDRSSLARRAKTPNCGYREKAKSAKNAPEREPNEKKEEAPPMPPTSDGFSTPTVPVIRPIFVPSIRDCGRSRLPRKSKISHFAYFKKTVTFDQKAPVVKRKRGRPPKKAASDCNDGRAKKTTRKSSPCDGSFIPAIRYGGRSCFARTAKVPTRTYFAKPKYNRKGLIVKKQRSQKRMAAVSFRRVGGGSIRIVRKTEKEEEKKAAGGKAKVKKDEATAKSSTSNATFVPSIRDCGRSRLPRKSKISRMVYFNRTVTFDQEAPVVKRKRGRPPKKAAAAPDRSGDDAKKIPPTSPPSDVIPIPTVRKFSPVRSIVPKIREVKPVNPIFTPTPGREEARKRITVKKEEATPKLSDVIFTPTVHKVPPLDPIFTPTPSRETRKSTVKKEEATPISPSRGIFTPTVRKVPPLEPIFNATPNVEEDKKRKLRANIFAPTVPEAPPLDPIFAPTPGGEEASRIAVDEREERRRKREEEREIRMTEATPKPSTSDAMFAPMIREVPPLEPIFNSTPSGGEARKKKLLAALAKEECFLVRQDRIWQNEMNRREWLLRPKTKNPPGPVVPDVDRSESLRFRTYNELPEEEAPDS